MFWKNKSVGTVGVSLASMKSEESQLIRVRLPRNTRYESLIRGILDTNFAVDIIDDPHGFYHEAVPYKHIIVGGRSELAESLKLTLPRYFSPLLYRKFEFEIYHTRTSGNEFILFGDSLEADLGQEVGTASITVGGVSFIPTAHGLGNSNPYRFSVGQGRAVIAFGATELSEGLPCISQELNDEGNQLAISVHAGPHGPNFELYQLSPQNQTGKALPILGKRISSAEVEHNKDFEVYKATFKSPELSMTLIPEKSFSRILQNRRQGIDCLEVLGLIVPTPLSTRHVQAVALRFDENGDLLRNGFIEETSRFVMAGQREAVFRTVSGSSKSIRRPVGSIVPLGLKLDLAREMDNTIPNYLSIIHSDGRQSLGWIPLRVTHHTVAQDPWVTASELRYNRSNWVSQEDTDEAGAAIYMDWLNHAVELVVDTLDDGPQKLGLASWCLSNNRLFHGKISAGRSGLIVESDQGKKVTLRDQVEFRLGPLWVRYHEANNEIKSSNSWIKIDEK